MKQKIIHLFCIAFFISTIILGQSPKMGSINNLELNKEYVCSEYGALPAYIKQGTGKQSAILIPGLGFDASVFADFMEANKKLLTMYTVTIPGYGNTKAPSMPVSDTSYGAQYWNKGVLSGIAKLIEYEKLTSTLIIGHFVQGGQLALHMAIDYPGKVSGVVVMGAPAKFIYVDSKGPKEFPLAATIKYIDQNTAPKWFRTISKAAFDEGNYAPDVYSLDTLLGNSLWQQSASVYLPVMIRYLLEFDASDVTQQLEEIRCPVLVLRPSFNENVLKQPVNNYLYPQFIYAWDMAAKKNPLIKIVDVPKSAAFVWKDNQGFVQAQLRRFLN